jgi:hypothetical protein
MRWSAVWLSVIGVQVRKFPGSEQLPKISFTLPVGGGRQNHCGAHNPDYAAPVANREAWQQDRLSQLSPFSDLL